MDAHLLLGKLQYACGQYAEAIKHFKAAELQNLPQKKLPLYVKFFENNVDNKINSSRSLRIVAESYAVQGLCLQKDTTSTSKFKKNERDEEMCKSFDLASDLGLLYMQKVEKDQSGGTTGGTHSPQPPAPHKPLGVILEQAMQEAPCVFIQQGKFDLAIERYRGTLCAIEASNLNPVRLKFMCQMAEVLLQGAGGKYKPPLTTLPKSSLWKPKYYASLNQVGTTLKFFANESIF